MSSFRAVWLFLLMFVTVAPGVSGYQSFHGVGHGIPRLNYDSLFEAATPLKESDEGKSLVEACLQAYGGVQSLQKLRSLHLEYEMVSSFGSDTVQVQKYFIRDRRYRILRQSEQSSETRSLVGTQAWFKGSDTVVALSDTRYRAELFSYLALSMPLAVKTEPFTEIRYGLRTEDSLAYVYMLKQDSLMIVLGIDPEDHMIKSLEGVIILPDTPLVFINWLSDFRRVEEYIFPHSIVYISLGMEVGRSKLTGVEINPAFGDGDFLLSAD